MGEGEEAIMGNFRPNGGNPQRQSVKQVRLQKDPLSSLLCTLTGAVKACELLMAGKVALGVSRQAVAKPMDLGFTGVSRKVALTDAMSQGSTMGWKEAGARIHWHYQPCAPVTMCLFILTNLIPIPTSSHSLLFFWHGSLLPLTLTSGEI